MVEHFVMYPDRKVFVLPYSSVQFDLYSVRVSKEGTLHSKIGLPNSNYKWSLSNENIGRLDKSKGVLNCGKELGLATVYVEDIRGSENRVDNVVEVVEPWTIDILIKECLNGLCKDQKLPEFLRSKRNEEGTSYGPIYDLVHRKRYLIKAVVVDQRNNRILLTENSWLEWNTPEGLNLLDTSGNDELLVEASRLFSNRPLSIKLIEVKFGQKVYKPRNEISVVRSLGVYLPVKLIKPAEIINLPFIEGKGQSLKLHAVGGSGEFDWYSTNTKIAAINSKGVLVGKALGKTEIFVADKKNSQNLDSIVVTISELGQNIFVEVLKEVELNSVSETLVITQDKSGNRFTTCDQIKYDLDQNPSSIIESRQVALTEKSGWIRKLHQAMNLNEHLLQRITDNERYLQDYMRLSTYAEYIDGKVIKETKLIRIHEEYRNFGVCGKIELKGLDLGDSSLKISTGRDEFNDTQKQKVLTQLDTTHPVLDPKQFLTDEIVLAPGSSLVWTLNGGSQKWRESVQIDTSFEITPLNSQLTAYEIERRKDILKVFVQCDELGDQAKHHKIMIKTQNQRSQRLLEPILFTHTIDIKCGLPSGIKLFKIKDEHHFLTTARFTEDHYHSNPDLVTNKPYKLQVWAFDDLYKPFYNFSSLEVTWSSPELGNGVNLEGVDHLSDKLFVQDEHRNLIVENQDTQRISITASTRGLENRPGEFSVISDTLNLRVLKRISVTPAEKTVFNHAGSIANFLIKGGSGRFLVTSNDTSAFRITYHKQEKRFTAKPLREAHALITVQDQSKEAHLPATVLIRSVNPHHIDIKLADQLVQSGRSVNATINVFDQNGNRLDQDQLKYINFSLRLTSLTGNEGRRREKIVIESLGQNRFSILPELTNPGFEKVELEGEANVSTQEIEYKLNARKSFLSFLPAKPFPSAVYSSPGCLFTVQMIFSPVKTAQYIFDLKIRIKDDSVIKMIKSADNFASFEALKQGETEIEALLYEKNTGRSLNRALIPVTIGKITSVEVANTKSRRVHVGALVRLIAAPLINGHPLTPAWCQIEYEWKTSYTKNVKLGLPEISTKDRSIGAQPSNTYIAVDAVGLKAGEVEISIGIRETYKRSYYRSGRIESATRIRFIEPLLSGFPLYIGAHETQSDSLILPPNSGYWLKTNKNILNLQLSLPCQSTQSSSVTGLGNDVVRLDGAGFIQTGEEKGTTQVKILDKNELDNVRLIGVQVVDVYALVVEKSQMASLLSIGGKITLKIRLQDEFGRVFPTPLIGVRFSVVSSHSEVVSTEIDDHYTSLTIRGLEKGESVIFVHLQSNPEIYDVFRVKVGSIVIPTESPINIHVGGTIRFKLKDNSDLTESITWVSSDRDVVKINRKSGEAVAQTPGSAIISLDNSIQHETKINVYEVDTITINEGQITTFDNYQRAGLGQGEFGGHEIGISFSAGNRQLDSIFRNDHQSIQSGLKLTCSVDHPDWFEIEDSIQSDSHGSGFEKVACLLKPKTPYPKNSKYPTEVIVTAKLSSESGDFSVEATQQFKYKWGFQLNQDHNKVEKVSFETNFFQILNYFSLNLSLA